MKIRQSYYSEFPPKVPNRSPQESTLGAIAVLGIIIILFVLIGLLAANFFTVDQMYIIRPMLATCAVYVIFSYMLWFRTRTNLFGEIGFIYLSFAMAYTVLPAISLLMSGFVLPLGYDRVINSVITPDSVDFGRHFWRHVLFVSGVAFGYIVVRGRALPTLDCTQNVVKNNGLIIVVMIALVIYCIMAIALSSAQVTTYLEHYTRFDHHSWFLRRVTYICLILKSGGYFVILTLMFSQFNKYRRLIYMVVPLLCIYETVYSFGSRIETLILLLAVIGFYHYKANFISIKKGLLCLLALAILFSAVELVRANGNDLKSAQSAVASDGIKSASEFGSVYYTGFHLYSVRSKEGIPPRDWQMFFYEFVSLIPFIDHTSYHPQYWYARHYYPGAVVPPQTMGVIVDSAIWGGELDLLIRSLINGALFAVLVRWFIRWQRKWWVFTVYIYCYATCIMTLKYSVLYQLIPLTKILLPSLLLTAIFFKLLQSSNSTKAVRLDFVA